MTAYVNGQTGGLTPYLIGFLLVGPLALGGPALAALVRRIGRRWAR